MKGLICSPVSVCFEVGSPVAQVDLELLSVTKDDLELLTLEAQSPGSGLTEEHPVVDPSPEAG